MYHWDNEIEKINNFSLEHYLGASTTAIREKTLYPTGAVTGTEQEGTTQHQGQAVVTTILTRPSIKGTMTSTPEERLGGSIPKTALTPKY